MEVPERRKIELVLLADRANVSITAVRVASAYNPGVTPRRDGDLKGSLKALMAPNMDNQETALCAVTIHLISGARARGRHDGR